MRGNLGVLANGRYYYKISIPEQDIEGDTLIVNGSSIYPMAPLPVLSTDKLLVIRGEEHLNVLVEDFQAPANFSYDVIDEVIIVPINQQMVVYGELQVNNELVVDGKIILEV